MLVKESLLRRKWIILAFSFGLVTLGVSAYLMYREICRPKTPSNLLSTYGYLLRDKGEMDKLNEIMRSLNMSSVKTKKGLIDSCTFQCPKQKAQSDSNSGIFEESSSYQSEVAGVEHFNEVNMNFSNESWSSNDTYVSDKPRTGTLKEEPRNQLLNHGCCVSYPKYVRHKTMDSHSAKKKVRLVHFNDRYQFFITEVCNQVENCSRGCECKQQTIMGTALVVDEDVYEKNKDKSFDEMGHRIDVVTYPGWCKCINK